MIKRPAPKNYSDATVQALVASAAQQTGRQSRQRTYDPNFPLFETPVNDKVLVYIPNHVVMNADGVLELRKDKFAAHPYQEGRSYGNIRCTAGIVLEEAGMDGSCPFCNASAEVWELYNYEYREIAAQRSIAVDSPEAKTELKQVRIDLLNKRAISQAEVWYTFPIVVIDCEEKDGMHTTTPKRDAQGRLVGKPMWYSIREKTFIDKWEKAFDTAPTADGVPPTHPGGQWAVLNFTYENKDGKHDKMGSARALAVGFKAMNSPEYVEWAQYFDKLTEEWTPAKAMETLVDNSFRDMNESIEACDTLMKATRDKLALYKLGTTPQIAASNNTSAEQALAQFGAQPIDTPVGIPTSVPNGSPVQAPVGAPPQVATGVPVAPAQAPVGAPPQVPTGMPVADNNMGVQ